MSYCVRLMSKEDIDQVTEIDREAFPTQWPSPNYGRELKNQMAHYLIVYDDEKMAEGTNAHNSSETNSPGPFARFKQWFSGSTGTNTGCATQYNNQYIVGMVGFWIMADEAHITSIAVRDKYRNRGIGELLLFSAIELAAMLKANIVTLEVRVSNTGAQHLYSKYGFAQVGRRKAYYTDNREDAFVMTTRDINSGDFQCEIQRLKKAHARKCDVGTAKIHI